ncbi:hypothetical protein EBZ39_01825 [bacterium]|nr:hypothetical protein [bacterium]
MSDLKTVTGKCYTFRGLKFYAQNGFICLHDESTGEFYVLTRKEFLQRAQAISDEAKRLRHIAAQYPATSPRSRATEMTRKLMNGSGDTGREERVRYL